MSVLLAANDAGQIERAVERLKGLANTWVIALRTIDASAYALKQVIHEAGHDCLLVCADFRAPHARMQAIAMANDFAGSVSIIWDCTTAVTPVG
ncbi:hypothetical protein [Dyella sp.]|uniref:hypothetical protein n=1 Tax=Dyella sp. TaxID=1869338 RepID=UPI002D76C428|nr:hypothetical protein [Dyella sp.]HET6432780.1 hypothetical protein [Dyella sp.]